jgi:bifunctional non-homologous end joining protein LigD
MRQLQAPALPVVLPMLSTSAKPFDDPGCVFDVKWDGIRALASVDSKGLRLWGREGTDYTIRYPELEILRRLPAGTMLDGELVAIRDGQDFLALMERHQRRPSRVVPFFAHSVQYVVFDLLYFRGRSLLDRPLSDRRRMLQAELPEMPFVTLCEGVIGGGRKAFRDAVAGGFEGVVAKRLNSHYLPNRRGTAWRKIKDTQELACAVIGFRTEADGLKDLQLTALVDGAPAYVGSVELGIRGGRELLERLNTSRIPRPAVPCSLSARWVVPEMACTVRFCGWRRGRVWRDAVLVRWEQVS